MPGTDLVLINLPVWAVWALDGILILLIAYKAFTVLRGTRAAALLKGVAVLVAFTAVVEVLGLPTMKWILDKAWTMAFVALPVIFWPELRSMLEKLGRGRPFGRLVTDDTRLKVLVEEIAAAVAILAQGRLGALIVIERETGLKEYVEAGTKLDALVSRELLLQLFQKNTPLHDGAVIIKGDRIAAAGCYLPLSQNENLSRDLGTRHRAGVGLSEQSDALVLIVSEETGTISAAEEGSLTRYLDAGALAEFLEKKLSKDQSASPFLWRVWEREAPRGKRGPGRSA